MEFCERCSGGDAYILLNAERVCLACLNRDMAAKLGVKVSAYPEGMVLRDKEGKMRSFRIRKRLTPEGFAIEADERKPQGFSFEVWGELDCDQEELLSNLLEKAQKGLEETYIREDRLPSGAPFIHMNQDRLAGIVAWNEEDEEIPLVIVDGKPYSWEEIGKMLMTYEGFQLKLEILDLDDEILWQDED